MPQKSGRIKKKFSIALESQHRQWRNAIRARTYEVFTLITHFWIETSSLSLSFTCANDQHNDDVDNMSSGSRHKLDRNEQHAFGQPVELSKATSTTSKSESQHVFRKKHVFPSSSTSEIYSNKTYIYIFIQYRSERYFSRYCTHTTIFALCFQLSFGDCSSSSSARRLRLALCADFSPSFQRPARNCIRNRVWTYHKGFTDFLALIFISR